MGTLRPQRAGAAVLLLLVLSFVLFVLQADQPGDPVQAYLGANASPAAVAAKREQLGLDDPLPVRYVHFLGHAVHGRPRALAADPQRPSRTTSATFLPATVELVLAAFVVALFLAALFAVSGALRWRGRGAARRAAGARRPRRRSCWPSSASSSSTRRLGWLPGDRSRRVRLIRTDRVRSSSTASCTATGALFVRGPAAPDPARDRPGDRPRDRHRTDPAHEPRVDPARADHVRTARSKGLDEGHVLRHARVPQLARPRPLDGRSAARLHVRRRGRRRAGVQLARDRQLPRREHPGWPTSRRSRA